MSTETVPARDRQRVGLGTLAKRGLVAVVVAGVLDAAIVFAADAAGVAPNLDPLSYGPVLRFTTLGVVGATLVYGLLDRLAANPDRTFTVVAAVVLVLSWIPTPCPCRGCPVARPPARSRWRSCTCPPPSSP